MENFSLAFDNVLPLFLLILTGWVAGKTGFITQEFGKVSNRLVFFFCLPVLVFESLYKADFATAFKPLVVFIAIAGTFLAVPVLLLVSRLFVKGGKSEGAFMQGGFRGNYVIIAIPLIRNVFGPGAAASAAVLAAFALPVYNVLSIVILSSRSDSGSKPGPAELAATVIKNPMVIAVFAALPFSILGIGLPAGITKTLAYLSGLTVPLALLDIGCGLMRKRAKEARVAAFAAAIFKTVAFPVALTLCGIAAGMRGPDLGVLYCFGATPTAVASYTMAHNFGSDTELAGDIVIYSTLLSMVTLFLGIWILSGL